MPNRIPRPPTTPPALAPPALQARLPARIEAEVEAGVCWVYAAPGAGKTCAIRAWALACDAPVHWHVVHPEDHDPVACALALWRLFAGPRDPGMASFRQRLGQLGVRTAWELLLDELDARLVDQTWIVIDGLDAEGDLAQHPVWSALLLREFRALRFVVSSRDPVPGSWSRWLVNRHIVCFGFDDLCWTLPEAKAWTVHWGFEALASDEALLKEALEQSRGWGAGFEYLVRKGAAVERGPLVPGMQMLWAQLVETMPHAGDRLALWPLLEALGRLGEVRLGLVKELDSTGQLREQLSWLAGRAFLVQLRNDQNSSVYEFHPLFCALLWDVGQVPPLQPAESCRVAATFVQEGRCLEGLTLLARAQCWETFVQTLKVHGSLLCDEPSLRVLAEPLSRLPDGFVHEEQGGWLTVLTGISLLEVDYVQAIEQLKAALARPLEPLWQAIALDALTRISMLMGCDAHEIEAHINAIDALLVADQGSSLPDGRRLSLSLCGLVCAVLVCPGHPAQDRWRELAFAFSGEAFARPKVARLAATLVKMYTFSGSGEWARQLHRRLQWSEHSGAHRQTRIAILVSSFFIGLLSGRFEELMPISDELDAHWKGEKDVLWRSDVNILSAFAALSIGDRPRLAVALSRHKSHGFGRSPLFSLCDPLLKALVGASKSDYDQIIVGQQECIAQAQRFNTPFYETVIRSSLAISLLEVDRRQEAREQLEDARKGCEQVRVPSASWCVRLAQAYDELRHGTSQRCIELLSQVFFEMKEEGAYMLAIHFHRGFSELLSFALEKGIEVDFLIGFIRRTKKYHHYVESRVWPAKFELCVMGSFSLRVDGKDRTARFRQAAHRFELLTALMYFGGREVCESELIACVWPYVRGDARTRLRQAIRRLSQSLGRADAILWSDGRVSLNPRLWQYDLWTLSEQVREYQNLCASSVKDPKIQLQRLRIASILGRDFVGPTQLPAQLRNLGGLDLEAWPESPPALRAKFP